MKLKARISKISREWLNDKWHIDFEIASGNLEELNDLLNRDLKLELKRYRKPRSTDANALLWACINDIAMETFEKPWNTYLRILKDYGKFTYICVPPKAVEAVKKQWRETEEVGHIKINGRDAVQLLCFYGSSTYDSAEFSKLINSVIEEMKELGLAAPLDKDVQNIIEDMRANEDGKKTD